MDTRWGLAWRDGHGAAWIPRGPDTEYLGLGSGLVETEGGSCLGRRWSLPRVGRWDHSRQGTNPLSGSLCRQPLLRWSTPHGHSHSGGDLLSYGNCVFLPGRRRPGEVLWVCADTLIHGLYGKTPCCAHGPAVNLGDGGHTHPGCTLGLRSAKTKSKGLQHLLPGGVAHHD